jgi:hypothetical protein
MAGQERLDDGALHANAPAVNQPDLSKAARNTLVQVLVDDGSDVSWGEGVKVERVLDREVNRLPVVGG